MCDCGYDSSPLQLKEMFTCNLLLDIAANQTCFWLAVLEQTLFENNWLANLTSKQCTYSDPPTNGVNVPS